MQTCLGRTGPPECLRGLYHPPTATDKEGRHCLPKIGRPLKCWGPCRGAGAGLSLCLCSHSDVLRNLLGFGPTLVMGGDSLLACLHLSKLAGPEQPLGSRRHHMQSPACPVFLQTVTAYRKSVINTKGAFLPAGRQIRLTSWACHFGRTWNYLLQIPEAVIWSRGPGTLHWLRLEAPSRSKYRIRLSSKVVRSSSEKCPQLCTNSPLLLCRPTPLTGLGRWEGPALGSGFRKERHSALLLPFEALGVQ